MFVLALTSLANVEIADLGKVSSIFFGGGFVVRIWHFDSAFPQPVIATVLLLAVQVETLLHLAAHESTGMPAWSKTYLLSKYDASTFTWFERMNRVNIRDIPTIYWLNHFVERVSDYKGGRVYIMSGQMGMVPYHVTRKHFSRVQWIDVRGLTDRAFTSCPATARRPRDSGGL